MTDQGGGANHVVAGLVVISEPGIVCIWTYNTTVLVAKGCWRYIIRMSSLVGVEEEEVLSMRG